MLHFIHFWYLYNRLNTLYRFLLFTLLCRSFCHLKVVVGGPAEEDAEPRLNATF